MTRHTYLLFALMTFGSLSVSAQMSLGYYKFKDGAEYTGELKGRRPNGKGKTVFSTYSGSWQAESNAKAPTNKVYIFFIIAYLSIVYFHSGY